MPAATGRRRLSSKPTINPVIAAALQRAEEDGDAMPMEAEAGPKRQRGRPKGSGKKSAMQPEVEQVQGNRSSVRSPSRTMAVALIQNTETKKMAAKQIKIGPTRDAEDELRSQVRRTESLKFDADV